MFDLRYHVASLAAVFLALVIGILVGVGIADTGVQEDSLRAQIAAERQQKEEALDRATILERQQEATQNFVNESYLALMSGRLDGKRIALVFVGSTNATIRNGVNETLDAAGGRLVRMRALELPLDRAALLAALPSRQATRYAGDDGLAELGRDVALELVDGGETPLWEALGPQLVEEQEGDLERPADAIVLNRTASPIRGATQNFLIGFYTGLADSGVPAVGVETSDVETSAIPFYRRRLPSSVDDLELATGKLALALLLAGGDEGHYGLRSDKGLMPPIEPLTAVD
jgi:hypothetical protein